MLSLFVQPLDIHSYPHLFIKWWEIFSVFIVLWCRHLTFFLIVTLKCSGSMVMAIQANGIKWFYGSLEKKSKLNICKTGSPPLTDSVVIVIESNFAVCISIFTISFSYFFAGCFFCHRIYLHTALHKTTIY